MNLRDLKPAEALANNFGVKAVCYGPPGSGKTPLLGTAPRPVVLVTEPGMLSMRGSKIACYDAFTPARVKEFMDWSLQSNEAKQFDTICIDSVSQLAEMELALELSRNKDGRKAYGEMSRTVMNYMINLYFQPQKHVLLLAKQTTVEENGTAKRKPYFPGQDLNVKVPHLFDLIMHLGQHTIPGVNGEQRALRTSNAYDLMARDRSGKLSPFEQPDLTAVFNKCLA
jgi:hypothetical protein